jgi:hypothetical protein
LNSILEEDIRIDCSHHAVDYASSRGPAIVEDWLSVVDANLVFGLLLRNLAIRYTIEGKWLGIYIDTNNIDGFEATPKPNFICTGDFIRDTWEKVFRACNRVVCWIESELYSKVLVVMILSEKKKG